MTRTLKLAGVHIALVAMLLRALLPAGWMPGSAEGTPLVVCSMNGPMPAHMADTGKHQPGHDDRRQNELCPFAASVHLATPAVMASVAPSMRMASFAPARFVAGTVRDTARYALASPRAPPSFA